MSGELHLLTFREIVDLLRTTPGSARDVFEFFLSRAIRHADLNAFTQLADAPPPVQHAPFFGAPLAVKDNIDVAGFRTTGGTPALQNVWALSDAPLVAKLRTAGASFLGKTNLHELSFGITSINACTGPVRNPYNPTLFAGGSSGGSAAAVAAGLAPIALGTDTGGSCRIPAAMCGVFGYRPSNGRYSNAGVIPLSTTRDTIGVLAKSVDDIMFLDAHMTGETPSIVTSDEFALGAPDDASLEPLDDAVRSAFMDALEECEKSGIPIRRINLKELTALSREVTRIQIAYEAPRGVAAWLSGHAAGVSVREVFEQVAGANERRFLLSMLDDGAVSEAAYAELSEKKLPALQRAAETLFRENRISAVLQPAAAHTARPIADGEFMDLDGAAFPVFPALTRLTDPASCAGFACLSMPLPVAGPPVGAELQTLSGEDQLLFSIAQRLETLFQVSR